MATLTSVEAIEFFRDNKRHIRVYYQFEDERAIRESCLEEDSGWFVRGNGIVTTTVKNKSPITVTRWTEDGGGPTQIRVFCLDADDNICQCQGEHELSSTQWTITVIGRANETNIAADSRLAIARPDRDDKSLRLFYQGKNDDPAVIPLREIRYNQRANRWLPLDEIIIQDAVGGTNIAAVSDKTTREVRLFYQGNDFLLREIFWDTTRHWGQRQSSPRYSNQQLIPNAPISAISWRDDEGDLQIQVFTIIPNTNNIAQMEYFESEWQPIEALSATYRASSMIASCRNTGRDMTASNPISVFYQSEARRAIEMTSIPADNSQVSLDLAAAVLRPAGIPICRGGYLPTENSTGGGGERETQRPSGQGTENASNSQDDELRRLRNIIDQIRGALHLS